MKVYKDREYYLHWKRNPETWNSDLKTLKKEKRVEKYQNGWYTQVIANYTGDFQIVDCTCDKEGNFHPIFTSNLKPF